jgi:hypothetical protein
MLLTPCEKGEEKRRGVSITRRSKGARPPLCRRVDCELRRVDCELRRVDCELRRVDCACWGQFLTCLPLIYKTSRIYVKSLK